MKIGRNEPCPCGSGHKFKKCCIEEVERIRAMEPKNDYRDQVEKQKVKEKTFLEIETERIGEEAMLERCKSAMVIELEVLEVCMALEVETLAKQGEIISVAIKELVDLPVSASREGTIALFESKWRACNRKLHRANSAALTESTLICSKKT